MATLLQTLDSQTHWIPAGTQTVFPLSFAGPAGRNYLSQSHVKVKLVDSVTKAETPILTGITFPSAQQIQILPAVPPAPNRVLVIYRDTPKQVPVVDYTFNALIDDASLDLSALQELFAVQEANDRVTVYAQGGPTASLAGVLKADGSVPTTGTFNSSANTGLFKELGVGLSTTYGKVDVYYDGAAGQNANKSFYGFHLGGVAAAGMSLQPNNTIVLGSVNAANRDMLTKPVQMSLDGGLAVAQGGVSPDPYGAISVTVPNNQNYSAFSITRAGTSTVSIGLTTANALLIGSGTAGTTSTITAPWATISSTAITTPGHILASNQPLVSAVMAAAGQLAVSNTTVVFGTVRQNRGGYNPGTGTFTAPVAGTYLVSYTLEGTTSAGAAAGVAGLLINGSAYTTSSLGASANSTSLQVGTYSEIIPLSLNDVVAVRVFSAPAGGITLLGSAAQNRLNITLLS